MVVQNPLGKKEIEQKMYTLIQEQQSSSLTAKEFCTQNHISQGRFYYWLKKYRGLESAPVNEGQSSFKLLQVRDELSDSGPGLFAEYKGLKIYGQVPSQFLKDLIS